MKELTAECEELRKKILASMRAANHALRDITNEN